MKASTGDKVKVNYTGTLSNGEQFDSSIGREPLEFDLGAGQVIPGFDKAVIGLGIGETVTITIPADEAYGVRDDKLIQHVPLEFFGEKLPEKGWMLELQSPEGQVIPATVVDINEENATLDINHPLAGEDLTFEIELVEIIAKD
ncbi:MAG: peptidylprolyl isomerase [Coriobacteriia bacterium]|nr:peptidylprolyl isomerase [Coriobacteriia bacterium]